jgi:hypothetical protein
MVINDFLKLRRYISSNGRISYTAPHNKDGHCDIVSAIVLGLHSIQSNPINNSEIFTTHYHSTFGNRIKRL